MDPFPIFDALWKNTGGPVMLSQAQSVMRLGKGLFGKGQIQFWGEDVSAQKKIGQSLQQTLPFLFSEKFKMTIRGLNIAVQKKFGQSLRQTLLFPVFGKG